MAGHRHSQPLPRLPARHRPPRSQSGAAPITHPRHNPPAPSLGTTGPSTVAHNGTPPTSSGRAAKSFDLSMSNQRPRDVRRRASPGTWTRHLPIRANASSGPALLLGSRLQEQCNEGVRETTYTQLSSVEAPLLVFSLFLPCPKVWGAWTWPMLRICVSVGGEEGRRGEQTSRAGMTLACRRHLSTDPAVAACRLCFSAPRRCGYRLMLYCCQHRMPLAPGEGSRLLPADGRF